jgi:DNA-binding transcriptional LysR family regulator
MQAQGMRAIDLAGTLAAFRAEHPGVELKIRHAGGSSEMACEVREGSLDLAFVALPGDGPSGIQLIPLAREPIMLAMPAEHHLANSATIELAALRDETWVDLPAGWGIRMAVDRSFAAAGVTRTITYGGNDTATMIDFIRNGLAIGLLPRSLVDTTEDIAFVPIRNHPPQFQTAIAIPANRLLSAPPERCSRRSSATPAHDRHASASETSTPKWHHTRSAPTSGWVWSKNSAARARDPLCPSDRWLDAADGFRVQSTASGTLAFAS